MTKISTADGIKMVDSSLKVLPLRRMSESEAQETLQGTVERVTFHSEETGFSVLRVKVKGRKDLTAVVGHVPQVVSGEKITATGQWITDRTHGLQFKAEKIETIAPTGSEGILRFLGSGVISGVGPATAERIVARFGRQSFDIIEKDPKRLMEELGLKPATVQKIAKAWSDHKALRDVMVFLGDYGIGMDRASRIAKTFGASAPDIVKTDPYRLSRDVRGIGFVGADEIAVKIGVSRESPARIQAGVLHALEEAGFNGNSGLYRQTLIDAAERLLGVDVALIERAIIAEVKAGRMLSLPHEGHDALFNRQLAGAEDRIASGLLALKAGTPPWPVTMAKDLVTAHERKSGTLLSDSQHKALELVVSSKVSVITGGPGVGKTTLLAALLALVDGAKLTVALAAPTGRAAKRMAEQTKREAKTLHRLLEIDPSTGQFRKGGSEPLDADVFVVDEASMIDIPLMDALMSAIPEKAALVLVGDVDQLPSVGPGKVLGDIIDSGKIPVARLTEIFRQAAESRIIVNAHRVNQGLDLEPTPAGIDGDFFWIEQHSPEDAIAKVLEVVGNRIPRRFGLDPRKDIQVLSPMQRGVLGTRNLNVELQKLLNPDMPDKVERFGYTFAVGDRIMQTENDYERDIFNGDLGQITSINHKASELLAQFDNREITFQFSDLEVVVPAYAMTVHKAQGSEYPAVVLIVARQHGFMLARNLIYTAMTRGRKLVVIIGEKSALNVIRNDNKDRSRITRLKSILSNHLL